MTETKYDPKAIIFITIDGIQPNPFQPPSRLKIDEATAEKFGKSIFENGLQQYPIVRENKSDIQMVDGARRLAGYRWLVYHEKLEMYRNIPVIMVERTDRQMVEDVLETGTVRDNLSAIDLAHIFKQMTTDPLNLTQEEIGKKHNCSQGEIANTIRLLELPTEYQQMVISHDITETHARYLLTLKDRPGDMAQLAGRVRDEHLTVNALDMEIKMLLQRETKPPKTVQIERNATPPAHTPPAKAKLSTPPAPAAAAATNTAGETEIEPVEVVKVKTAPRKLQMNETENGVFCGVMKLGKQGFFKTIPGTIELVDIEEFLMEAEKFWNK